MLRIDFENPRRILISVTVHILENVYGDKFIKDGLLVLGRSKDPIDSDWSNQFNLWRNYIWFSDEI